MEDVIRVQDQYYILATSSRADDRTRVLKHDDTFAVFDRFGDIEPFGLGEQGIYHDGTRHLSRLDLRLNGARPLLLSSSVREDNDSFVVDLTNPDIPLDADTVVRRDVVHVRRVKCLWQAACHERLELTNHSLEAVKLTLMLRFGADFVDIFEVRGITRARRGRILPTTSHGSTLILAYEGLDGVTRKTIIEFSETWSGDDQGSVIFGVSLVPQESRSIEWRLGCETSRAPVASTATFDMAYASSRASLERLRSARARIETANEQFNDWLGRSSADLDMMLTETAHGLYPYAGVPWFSTPFGRDGIITALELLWIDPDVARGVLTYLAAMQATELNPDEDAEPGKIMHEARSGEMAALREVPFGRYYGSIDSTPLFVVLAGAYFERTGDRAFIESIWPNVEAALHWIDTHGDMDGDGLVEYIRKRPDGLVHQGWKDSQDSIFHADGSLAEPPIALCEVQAYAYLAQKSAAAVAAAIGHRQRAAALQKAAKQLRRTFESAFWCEEIGTYALALDGAKRPCRVGASNAGHCLFGRIASPERAVKVARTLTGKDMFAGWGIRTLSDREARYNPMSYHNGSVWPHDNALVARGLSKYGLTDAATAVFRGLFDLSQFVDEHRLPELVCGFRRQPGEGPTLYPVACAPQSWAAAAVFMLLQSSLGVSLRAPERQIVFERALLPDFLPWVRITNLRVGDASVDLLLERHPYDVGIQVLRRTGEVDIVAIK